MNGLDTIIGITLAVPIMAIALYLFYRLPLIGSAKMPQMQEGKIRFAISRGMRVLFCFGGGLLFAAGAALVSVGVESLKEGKLLDAIFPAGFGAGILVFSILGVVYYLRLCVTIDEEEVEVQSLLKRKVVRIEEIQSLSRIVHSGDIVVVMKNGKKQTIPTMVPSVGLHMLSAIECAIDCSKGRK